MFCVCVDRQTSSYTYVHTGANDGHRWARHSIIIECDEKNEEENGYKKACSFPLSAVTNEKKGRRSSKEGRRLFFSSTIFVFVVGCYVNDFYESEVEQAID